ncbi:hypothetical protein RSOL_519700 [Rhizoctonia solani AG-3 Rhs1AP]|uniref:Uncharacterized protein n=1 Tax=Rhizoctonia solani AG-3 Rhs1AP TaxID=1086054 RepID=X8JXA6_9AGAM|nr:hypothetical protein RSOL_519700 [Rhizoctonia solani AG-3 Rhs1AP]
MGFITQTFGNTFRASNANSSQQIPPTARKLRPKPKLSKDLSRSAARVSPSTTDPSPVERAVAHKKRRHVSPDGDYMLPHSSVAADTGRQSCSSSVGSDEPLIVSSKGKGKSTGGAAYEPNQNQSPYTNAAWPSTQPRRLEARPPTTNLLDAYERSELVRRSRKLGSILGETPRLLDVADECNAVEALSKLEGRQAHRANLTQSRPASSPGGRPNCRRSLTLDNASTGTTPSPFRPGSSPRHSFRLNDENSSTTPRSPYQRSTTGPRFGRNGSTARHPPVLRLSATPTNDGSDPYLGRRHSSDLSVRRGGSLNSMDLNVVGESGSDISAPNRPSFDTNSIGSSTMPTFARPQSPSSLLDSASLCSKISLSDSMASIHVGVPGRSAIIDQSLPPSPTTPLTPILTQAEDARRKMRKLARHLGESVPADLVLGISGARPARHDYLLEEGPSQFLQVPTSGTGFTKPKYGTNAQAPFCLGKPPSGHRKTQSVWKGGKEEKSTPSRRMVRRASSAEHLCIDTPTQSRLAEAEKARNVHRAVKMLQLFGAPPPHELYANIKSRSLDLPPDSATSTSQLLPANHRASVNSFKDLAYILDHDNRNSLLALIGDAMPNTDARVDSSLIANQGASNSQGLEIEEESFKARCARANRLAKFFGVSYRDLFDAVCAEDTQPIDAHVTAGLFSHPALKYLPEHAHGSEVVTNNGSRWVEPQSVEEVLDRLRAMKAPR